METSKKFVMPGKEDIKNFKMPPMPIKTKQFPTITLPTYLTEGDVPPYVEEMIKIKSLLKKALKANHFRQAQEVSELLNLAIHSVNIVLDSDD